MRPVFYSTEDCIACYYIEQARRSGPGSIPLDPLPSTPEASEASRERWTVAIRAFGELAKVRHARDRWPQPYTNVLDVFYGRTILAGQVYCPPKKGIISLQLCIDDSAMAEKNWPRKMCHACEARTAALATANIGIAQAARLLGVDWHTAGSLHYAAVAALQTILLRMHALRRPRGAHVARAKKNRGEAFDEKRSELKS